MTVNELKISALATLLLLATPLAFSQSVARKSPNLPKMSEPIAVLDHATGWFVDEGGKWYSNDRAIGNDYEKEILKLPHRYERSQVEDFIVIELRTLTYNGKKLNILLKRYIDGRYLYPSIRVDWYSYTATDFCAISGDELSKVIKALGVKKKAQRVSLKCVYGDTVEDISSTSGTLKQKIIASIVDQQKSDYAFVDTVHVDVFPIRYEGANLVRFHWSNEDIYSHYFSPSDFDRFYYEVDLDSFAALFDPPVTSPKSLQY